ncbi:unnamed protein product [Sympodiomycopsis kandeliae]
MSLARSIAGSRPVVSSFRAASISRSFTTAKAADIPVASSDDGAPTSSVTVALRAGPRFETSPGVASALKHFAFKSNAKRSALRVVRESELYGGLLSSSLSKEHLFLTTEFLRGDEDYFVELLGDVLATSRFVHHEFKEEVLPALRSEYEQVSSSPSTFGFDVLTQTAYRQRGLGASLYASQASPVGHQQVASFAKSAFARNNIAVLGTGIESNKLASLVSKNFAQVSATGQGAINAGPSTYFGGEQRVAFAADAHSDSPTAHHGHFFLGFQGSSSPEYAVLRALLGGESSVKWSQGLSPLSQITSKVQGSSAHAFNLTFSDSGLFGAYVTAPTATLTQVAKEVTNAMKSIASGVSSEDLSRAIAKAKFQLATSMEDKETLRQSVGSTLLSNGQVRSLEEQFGQLDTVKAADVSSAAEKALKSKPTTVAIGDVHQLPYADDVL